MAAAVTAALAAQSHFWVNEPRGVGPPINETGMINHGPMPADGAGRFDDMPPSPIL
jgi:hypothetical protein